MKKFNQFLSELEQLNQVFTKKGQVFLDDLLNGELYINLKIDTSSFIIKKDNNELKYFGREGKQEIDTIKRAGSNIWEPSIEHIEKQQWEKLPNGITIATEMFNPKISTIIKWDKAPKGGMIISWIKMKGKTVPLNDPIYDMVADILQITPPPVIHAGKLNAKQKQSIEQLVNDPDVLSGEAFAAELLSIFTLKPAHAFLAGKFIEGVVIYDSRGNSYKITDNFFKIKNKEKNKDKSDVFHELISATAYKHIEAAFKSVKKNPRSMKKIMSKDGQDRYISFIASVTGTIVQKIAKDMGNVDAYKSDVENSRYSNITADKAPAGVSALVQKYWWAEDLFRTLLYSLRRDKKRLHAKSGLTADRKNLINDMVSQMKELEIL